MIQFNNFKLFFIINVSFLCSTPNIAQASDSVSDDESSYKEETSDKEAATTPKKTARHFCLWEGCREDEVSYASAKDLYEHVRDEHATKTDDHYYKCYWQGCRFEKEGDRHMHRHFLSHCDSVHIKYGAIRCEKCDTKLYYTENRSSHKKRCPGKPPKRATVGQDGFHCQWKNCRDKSARKINDGEQLYKHIQEKHITKEQGKMKDCLWQGCQFRPNIGEKRMPSVFREAILRHCAKEHADYRPFKCPLQGCKLAFYNKANLDNHKKICPNANVERDRSASSTASSLEEEKSEEPGSASAPSLVSQDDDDDDRQTVRRSKRLKKRQRQEDVLPNQIGLRSDEDDNEQPSAKDSSNQAQTPKRRRLSKNQPLPQATVVEALVVPDNEEPSAMPQAFEVPVPLEWAEEEYEDPEQTLPIPTNNDDTNRTTSDHYYNQPTPVASLTSSSSSSTSTTTTTSTQTEQDQQRTLPTPVASLTSSSSSSTSTTTSIPPTEEPQQLPLPDFSGMVDQNISMTAQQQDSSGFYYAPQTMYQAPTNQVFMQPRIYTCSWMGACGAQFDRQDFFLQHVQQAHLLMCWFNNCAEGPYMNEEALFLHLARKHGCQ